MSNNCLNCNNTVNENYCANCGQKTSVHRYSIKHFVEHDFVHGVFHFDKGFLYTLKELFTRPGHSVREFIQGKRARHFNVFTFIVLVLTVGHFLSLYSPVSMAELMSTNETSGAMNKYEEFSRQNPKVIPFLLIPVQSLLSFLFFRKAKQNYTEHLVLNTFKAGAEHAISILFTIICICYPDQKVLFSILVVFGLLNIIYSVWFYMQYFSAFGYTKTGLVIRSILSALAPQFISMIVGIVMAFYVMLK